MHLNATLFLPLFLIGPCPLSLFLFPLLFPLRAYPTGPFFPFSFPRAAQPNSLPSSHHAARFPSPPRGPASPGPAPPCASPLPPLSLPPADRWVPPVRTFPFPTLGSYSGPSPIVVRRRPARAASRARTLRPHPPYLKPRPRALASPQAAAVATAFAQNPKAPELFRHRRLHASPARRSISPPLPTVEKALQKLRVAVRVFASRFFSYSPSSHAHKLLAVIPSCPWPPAAVSGRCCRSPSL
jgi:hypothetical protein